MAAEKEAKETAVELHTAKDELLAMKAHHEQAQKNVRSKNQASKTEAAQVTAEKMVAEKAAAEAAMNPPIIYCAQRSHHLHIPWASGVCDAAFANQAWRSVACSVPDRIAPIYGQPKDCRSARAHHRLACRLHVALLALLARAA